MIVEDNLVNLKISQTEHLETIYHVILFSALFIFYRFLNFIIFNLFYFLNLQYCIGLGIYHVSF